MIRLSSLKSVFFLASILWTSGSLFASPEADAALLRSAEAGDLERVKKSLVDGAGIDSTNSEGMTGLLLASANGHLDVVRLLLEKGASVEKASTDRMTPLFVAAGFNRKDCVLLMLAAKARVDAANENGVTPLMVAALNGHTEMVRLLMDAGADIHLKSADGTDAFAWAARKGHIETMRLLDPVEASAFELPADEALLLGEFRDSDGVREPGVKCTLSMVGADDHHTETTDSLGQFRMVLKKGRKYTILCDKFGNRIEFHDVLGIPAAEGPFIQKLELIVQYVQEYRKTYKLENVYFDSGKSALRKEAGKSLDDLAKALMESPTMIVEIAGHTDNVGKPEKNMELSRRRAEAVRSYVIGKGVPPERILAKGYGPVKPVADNRTQEGRQQNRRTEARVIRE